MKKGTFTQLSLFFALFLSAASASAQGVINTIAGNGIAGFFGDGLPAASAQFRNPAGVSVNNAGDIFIADKNNSRVRMISGATGITSTYAGTGVFGLSGFGGPANAMDIRYPDAVSVTPTGDLLVSDWYNDMVFDVDGSTHRNHHHHGDGHQGNNDNVPSYNGRLEIPAGAVGNQAGFVFIADNGNNRVRMVTPDNGTPTGLMIHTLANASGALAYSGDGGPSTAATFRHVTGIAYEPIADGYLYISDQGNNVIRKIDIASRIISTVVGSGIAGYSGDGGVAIHATLKNPGALFIDGSNNLYICDRGNNVIRKVDLTTNIITTIAGNGTAGFSGDGFISTSAQLNDPEGICVDNLGKIYIADMNNQRIRVITPSPAVTPGGTSIIYTGSGAITWATGSSSTSAMFGSTTTTREGYISATQHQSLDLGNPSMDETRIFPNPSNGTFTLQTAMPLQSGSVTIYNSIGETVYRGVIDGRQAEIKLSQPAGIYTVSVLSASFSYTEKITIAK